MQATVCLCQPAQALRLKACVSLLMLRLAAGCCCRAVCVCVCMCACLWGACRRLHYFSHETTSGLSKVVAAAEAEGGVAGYVLDLRNDPGGVFEEAVAMAALFEVRAKGNRHQFLLSGMQPEFCVFVCEKLLQHTAYNMGMARCHSTSQHSCLAHALCVWLVSYPCLILTTTTTPTC